MNYCGAFIREHFAVNILNCKTFELFQEGQFDIVRLLLYSGADPAIENKDGKMAYTVSSSDKTQSVYRECLLQAASQSK